MSELENGNSVENLEEPSVTMVDVLEQQNEMEEEYAAVLGASDEKCCTYQKGSIKRQALYSCLTCCPDAKDNLEKCAGICLACSNFCHENHELVELYTKRNFRCDCPTERIPNGKCTLNTDILIDDKKMPKNSDNFYNHNFQGLYCACKRPFPDPENPSEEAMLQCAVCEDWYHQNHLDIEVKKLREDFHEMVCAGCMTKYEFLQDYNGIALKRLEATDESNDVSVEDDKLKSDLDKSISEIMKMSNEDESDTSAEPNSSCKVEIEKKIENGDVKKEENGDVKEEENGEPSAKRQKLENGTECKRPKIKSDWEKGAKFWPTEWRSALCSCKECLTIYEDAKVSFLLDPEDCATHYEERGKKNAKESSYEQGIRALSTIGRTQQIDAITEYNRMKDKLKDYLKTFVASKKVVTEEDINRFFQEMKNENNANIGQPYFCR